MPLSPHRSIVLSLLMTGATSAFLPNMILPKTIKTHTSELSMGFFDNLKTIFSEEGKKNRAEWDEREKAEMIKNQKEIYERRNNPEKMREYMEKVNVERLKLAEANDVYEFQGKVEEGYDAIDDWKRLKDEGKILMGDDLERDPTSERLGSEGLVDVRLDERMPYIDQGYVDEDADVVGKLMGMFGGKKKDE